MNRNLVSLLTVLSVSVAVVAFSATPVLAQDPLGLNDLGLSIYGRGLIPAITRLIQFGLLIGGIVAFLFVLYGGFIYLTAGGDSAAAGKGRTMIVNAIIGMVIIFLSLAIVQFFADRLRQEADFGSGITGEEF